MLWSHPMFKLQSYFPKALLQFVALAVASVSFAGGAVAQSEEQSEAQSDRSVLDTQSNTGIYAVAALGRSSKQVDVGSAAHAAPYELSGNSLGLQLAAGYRPLPAWSAEFGYVRLGRTSSGHSDATIDGLMLSALGYLPTPLLNIYGRMGLYDARTYGAYGGSDVARPVPIHHRDTNLAFGVGLSTNFGHNLNLRLESQGFQVTHAKDTSLVTIAFVWSFL